MVAQAGWNLIGLLPGTTLTGAPGPFYMYRPGDTVYEVVPVSDGLQQGWGYWADFPAATNPHACADADGGRRPHAPRWAVDADRQPRQ